MKTEKIHEGDVSACSMITSSVVDRLLLLLEQPSGRMLFSQIAQPVIVPGQALLNGTCALPTVASITRLVPRYTEMVTTNFNVELRIQLQWQGPCVTPRGVARRPEASTSRGRIRRAASDTVTRPPGVASAPSRRLRAGPAPAALQSIGGWSVSDS
eukprot:753476-Hanusia_phi.AAC.18